MLPDIAGDVDITVAGRNPGNHPGIRLHRVKTLPRQDVTKVNGFKVTSVARTICDLAATESAHATEQAFQEALYREIVTVKALKAVLEREPTPPGRAHDPPLISDPRLTRSENERRLLKLIATPQLPNRSRTSRSTATKPTCTGPQHASSSSSTAGRPTATATRSRATASATRSWSQTVSACSASPTGS